MQKMIDEAKKIITENIENEKIVKIFDNVYEETLTKSIETLSDGSIFMVTGDIPAMWLRDSACQVRPYLPFINKNKEVRNIIKKLIDKQFEFILEDPYANAFNKEDNGLRWDDDTPLQKPTVWEQKYELDSHCFPILLAYQYWKLTNDASIFTEQFYEAIDKILNVWKVEQNHNEESDYTFFREETNYLVNNGKGSETKKTGLIWSAFRPSDDPCKYHYNIPGNLFALYSLELLEEIINKDNKKQENLIEHIVEIREKIVNGINEYGIVTTSNNEKIYAYEVDGLGNYNLMDDSNMPSLLSLPLLSGTHLDEEIYQNTREYILSPKNPYFYSGKAASGIGSPHTPDQSIWPMAIAIEGLTSNTHTEKLGKLKTIAQTDAGTYQVHESFNKDNPADFTREWFLWANAMFCELALDYSGITIKEAMEDNQ